MKDTSIEAIHYSQVRAEMKYNVCYYLVAIQHCSHKRRITRYRVKSNIYTNDLSLQKINDDVIVKRVNCLQQCLLWLLLLYRLKVH